MSNALFWQRMHGGSTHFPLVLILASVMFDLIAWRTRDETLSGGLHAAGLGSAVVGVLGGFGAVISGLVLTRGHALGSGYEKYHHLFVWPAFTLCVVFVVRRVFQRGRIRRRPAGLYLAGMGLASALMMVAGYWGGEMVLGAEPPPAPTTPSESPVDQATLVTHGHQLFLLNCAHCHAADASGDEGPDLHGVLKSDARIATLIKNGVKGEMPRFSAKLSDPDIQALIAFIRSLK